MAWDPETTLRAAKCFTCLTKAQAKAIQTYSLAITAGVNPDPAYLLAASACMKCIPVSMLTAAQAALMYAIAGGGLTLGQVIQDSACSSCIPKGLLESIKAYQYSVTAQGSLDPYTLAQASNCLNCLTEIQHDIIQTYLLCVLNGEGGCGESGSGFVDGVLPEPIMQTMTEIYYSATPPVYVIVTLTEDLIVAEEFDSTLCQFNDIATGGGDTFDCYTVEALSYPTNLPHDAGTGFTGLWFFDNSVEFPMTGDDLDSYPVGAVTSGTLSGGTGFTGAWLTN